MFWRASIGVGADACAKQTEASASSIKQSRIKGMGFLIDDSVIEGAGVTISNRLPCANCGFADPPPNQLTNARPPRDNQIGVAEHLVARASTAPPASS